ncbi:hypothetical protein VW35_18850 [Devosia soli]|uniref:ABC transporter domain-containing protein n=1 Tax=Devosia soli TaxID=361041 RepID=A0A0F5L0V0_9HYPH|nr:ABC transporter ATP-binding protein [Devosia soli]KKB75829.1 hypothetical protein VW35_18850 [Devosia soli]
MLQLSGLTKTYGDQPGVDRVDLAAPSGSRTVIVGPSGSGKTTLLRLIAGFETPDAGNITLDGRPLDTVPPHQRNIAYVAQEGALFPHMSVAENIGFAIPRQASNRESRIDTLLARVGLSAAMKSRRPHELSGGQQQRVALARALAQQPALMLLDEPFSALDTGLREAMRDMVEAVLREAGIASILVTHDQSEALAFADHLVVMRDARIADAGQPQRLYEQPIDIETAKFLGETIIFEAAIRGGVADTPLGPLAVDHSDTAKATILVRPEQVRIAENGTLARILHSSYRGAARRLELECQSAGHFSIDVPAATSLTQGDSVCLAVNGRGHVFRSR